MPFYTDNSTIPEFLEYFSHGEGKARLEFGNPAEANLRKVGHTQFSQGSPVIAAIVTISSISPYLLYSAYPITSWYHPSISHTNLVTYNTEDDLFSSEANNTSTTYSINKGQYEYSIVMSRLFELLESNAEDEEDEEEYGASVPTKYALNKTLSLLAQTYELINDLFPRAAVSTSFEGGIRVQWMYPHANVRLVIAPNENEQTYIYFETEEEYDTEEVSPINLANRLMWLQRIASYA